MRAAADASDVCREANARNALGAVQHHTGDYRQAADHHTRALDLAETAGQIRPLATALLGLSAARRSLGDPDTAFTLSTRAGTIATPAGYALLEADTLTELAAVHTARRDYTSAAHHAAGAATRYRQSSCRPGHARAHLLLHHATSHLNGHAPDTHPAALLTECGMSEEAESRALLHPPPTT
jgi:tetratricopeptide (TPR) repeat protein